jgi:hypothetical protein
VKARWCEIRDISSGNSGGGPGAAIAIAGRFRAQDYSGSTLLKQSGSHTNVEPPDGTLPPGNLDKTTFRRLNLRLTDDHELSGRKRIYAELSCVAERLRSYE